MNASLVRTAEEVLRDVVVLGNLPPAELSALGSCAETRKVVRSDALFVEGRLAEGLFVVRSGELKVTRLGRDGREQIFYIARPGRPIVEGVRFDGGSYPANAIALRPTSAVFISNEKLSELGQTHPRVLTALVDLRARRADRNLALIADLSLRTVPARLASFICTLIALRQAKGEDPSTLVRELTTETVAGRLGTVREEVSRGLALLEREGALRVSPQVIEVLDVSRLESIAYGHEKKGTGA